MSALVEILLADDELLMFEPAATEVRAAPPFFLLAVAGRLGSGDVGSTASAPPRVDADADADKDEAGLATILANTARSIVVDNSRRAIVMEPLIRPPTSRKGSDPPVLKKVQSVTMQSVMQPAAEVSADLPPPPLRTGAFLEALSAAVPVTTFRSLFKL
jgi:hypothetical protein